MTALLIIAVVFGLPFLLACVAYIAERLFCKTLEERMARNVFNRYRYTPRRSK